MAGRSVQKIHVILAQLMGRYDVLFFDERGGVLTATEGKYDLKTKDLGADIHTYT